ncbi:hypothetical protein KKD52_16250 [Myxococcota bacterium]|jgi:hypothetical protein|nr:hypothetical protein [Myxococcota bacterium]MBU1412740.1 hypothetical protein [Myxococcota bacterium]MBU1511907.1 hypothetical protein [Myxococcota bacterium]
MKITTFLFTASVLLLMPLAASAQMYTGPGTGMTPYFEPHRFGWVHEGSLAVAGLTGEGREDYTGGGGGYYSGLFRLQPSLALGVHVAGGYINLGDGTTGDTSTLNYQLVAGEGRVYIPAGMIDFWGSIVIGGGRMDETVSTSYVSQEVRSGAVVGFGAGGSFFITPNVSIGAHLRMYRMFPSEDEAVAESDVGSSTDYVGLWWTVGVNAALHY